MTACIVIPARAYAAQIGPIGLGERRLATLGLGGEIEQAPRLAGPMCADQAVGEGDACLREPGTVGNVEPGAQLHRPAKLDLRIAGLPQMALCDA